MDLQISRWIVKIFGENKSFAVFLKILTYGGSVWLILGIIAVLLIFKKTRKMAICALFSVAVTYLLNDFVIKNIVQRSRPFVEDPSLGVMCSLAGLELPTGYSMTSGHSAVSMALAVMIAMHSWKIGIPAICYSLLVGFSRIFLCVHYFSDVIAGFALGIVISVITYFLAALIIKKFNLWRGKNEKNRVSNSQSTQG